MSWEERFKVKVRGVWQKFCCCQDPALDRSSHPSRVDLENGGNSTGLPLPAPPQYRLEATSKGQRTGISRALFSCICGNAVGSGTKGIGINHNQRIASTLHWMFRVNFIFLFAVMCMIFFVWVMIFAGFIIGAGRIDHECVRVGGEPFAEAESQFADAFALSWTTFSTVGYGSTYPALGHEVAENPTNCLFITIICSLESFLGVLYSGFCGAILFGKVLRIQSHAQVIFSDPIVIRYGSGLQQGHDHFEDDDDDEDDDDEAKKLPCPVLEFRVVNRLFAEAGGEIMDATLNVVANVDANDSEGATEASKRDIIRTDTEDSRLRPPRDHFPSQISTADSHSVDTTGDDSGRFSTDAGGFKGIFSNFNTKRDGQTAVDEDPSARLVNKRIFSKMLIEASDHPFFKRVWLGRHVLDETSPILKPKVRRAIRRNGGYWPYRLNSHEAVRDSLQFNQILVSLNGVSNVSASDVYAQKIYDFVDINVGYQFVNILYKDTDQSLKVDTDLINDVREQHGGGGEPLILEN